jgi:hypothetical protein
MSISRPIAVGRVQGPAPKWQLWTAEADALAPLACSPLHEVLCLAESFQHLHARVDFPQPKPLACWVAVADADGRLAQAPLLGELHLTASARVRLQAQFFDGG